MSEPIKDAADELRRRIEARVAEIRGTPAMAEILKLHQSLNSLEDLLDQSKTTLADIFGLSVGESRVPRVRVDDLYGLAALDAAKRYMKKMPDARPFDEIVEAITAGGGKVDNVDELRKGLSRSTFDIVKIGERYGALEKYPHIKLRRGRRGFSR